MYLSQIKIVDLRFSKWDKETSDPSDGRYEFSEKEYIDYHGKTKARPDWHFSWCRYDSRNNYRELRDWRIMWGYTPVKLDKDPYWPEPVPPDESGNYVLGDLILVKRRLIDELKDRVEKLKRSKGAGKAKLDDWQAKMEKQGASIPQSMVDELMGK